jgi:CRISP-associated protein Cas1
MKTHLNTLFVTTEGSYVAKDGEALVVRSDGEASMRVPVHLLSSVVIFGRIGMSPAAMALCSRSGVSITYLTPEGRLVARVTGFTTGNILLRKAHFRTVEDPGRRLELARAFVVAKLYNTRVLVLRSIRDHGDPSTALRRCAAHLARCLAKARSAGDLDLLRGTEGEAARHYFESFGHLLRHPSAAFEMRGRSRRPPRDRVNALLSFLYSLLAADCRSACEAVGLDPQAGFLHADRPGRAGLALDLMEELRAVIADRVALTLVNRQQLNAEDFVVEIGGAVRMKDDARRTVISQYHSRKAEELEHPFLGEKMTIGMLPLIQARLLAKAVRAELDGYAPFLWR